jgi:adenylate cyclase
VTPIGNHAGRSRLGNPLNWCNADKALLVACVVLPFAVWHVGIQYYYLKHPDVAPYIDLDFVARTIRLQAIVWIGGWVMLAAAAILLRGRFGNSRLFGIASMQLFSIVAPLLSYALGHYTTNYLGAAGMTAAIVAFLFFDRRDVYVGVAVFVAVFVTTVIAEQKHLIPYAPMLRELPVVDRHLHPSWLRGLGQMTGVILIAGIGLIFYIVTKWREREERLALLTDEVSRANELISRYVAAQVAEQILAGNVQAVERHQRRKLTLVFSDIKGFSEIADEVEPEELSEMLNEYLAEMTAIAYAYGATVDKFMGDAVMAFFGAPIAVHEDEHALAAVRMAQEMQRRVVELQGKWRRGGFERSFEVRIGINTGVASVGTFGAKGRLDYTAIGRQVNLAARLQAACTPGCILLSQATWLLVNRSIRCVPRGEIEVKGVHHPVQIYEVDEAVRSPRTVLGDGSGHHVPPPKLISA